MATTDQNITELPIKTASEVSDADYLMGIDLVEGYQVLTKDFADYVVNEAEITVGGKKQTTANAISEIGTTASNAQPKESGKGLSTNDFTNAYKTKLDGIATGAEVNVQSDWNASSGDAAILHKPTTLAGYGVKTEVDSLFDEKGLVDVVKGSDSVPYHFRRTPFGDRLKEKIVGGTVAWNQLVKNGDFASDTGWIRNSVSMTIANGEATVTATAKNGSLNQRCNIVPNHKYLASVKVKASSSISLRLYMSDSENYTVFSDIAVGTSYAYYSAVFAIGSTISDNDNRLGLRDTASSNWVQFTVDDFMLIDLTQMFGTTIADYIYSLEQTTAGAGVALFRELFPKNYYPFDAGSLQSVSGLQSHDEVGFNQWDEEWEVGGLYNASGLPWATNDRIRSKNFVKVLPNTNYASTHYFNALCFYDEDKNYIEGNSLITNVFKTPQNASYLKFATTAAYGTTYNHDICINISDSAKNGTYEPYKKHSYPLDSSLTLRGVPKLVDNKIKFDGDWYESEGKKTERYTECDLGTLNWTMFAIAGWFWADIPNSKNKTNNVKANAICSKYVVLPSALAGDTDPDVDNTDKSVGVGFNNYSRLYLHDSAYSDAASFKAAMSGVMLVYEKATPTVSDALPYANPQRCFEGGTEEYVTTGIVPVGHESEYVSNKAERFDALPDVTSKDGDYVIRQTDGIMELVAVEESLNDLLTILAPLENGTTASKAYSTGQYFLHNDQFCKAKTAIASGATFTLNTNYEVTTVAQELYTALH